MSMPTLPARESKHDSLDGQDAEASSLTAIGRMFRLTFWLKSMGFPLDPQKVKLFAGGQQQPS